MKLFSTGGRGKRVKTPITKSEKRIRVAITVLVVILTLFVTGCAVYFSAVKPPDPTKPEAPSHPVIDFEDDDEPEQIVDMGDRISDYFTFVVGAVDEDETRTDALMVCSFDVKSKKINVLNVPRDTICNNSTRGENKKINAAYGTRKGVEQTKTEIKRLVGFKPDYYIIVNFKGIAEIVDAIGGVEYEIPFRMYYKDPSQNLSIDFKPGMTHLDGEEVVEFLRWRKNNGGVKTGDSNYTGGDEERIAKQQEFLKYLASQVLDMKNATNIPKIAKAVFDNVKTDFSWGNMLWMAQQAIGLPTENLKMHTLPGYDSYSYAGTSDYLSFFFPSKRDTLTLVNEYFNPYVNKLTNLDIVSGPDKANPAPKKPTNTAPKEEKEPEPLDDPESGAQDPETGTTPSDKPSGSTGDKPSGSTGDKPSGGTGDKPSGGTGDKPSDGTGDKPSDGTGDKPSGGESTDTPSSGDTGTPPVDSGSPSTTTPPVTEEPASDNTTTIPPAVDPEA